MSLIVLKQRYINTFASDTPQKLCVTKKLEDTLKQRYSNTFG
ncbi:MAG: hypothetical protein WBM86_24955 [Waterburya sp.]